MQLIIYEGREKGRRELGEKGKKRGEKWGHAWTFEWLSTELCINYDCQYLRGRMEKRQGGEGENQI